MRGRKGIAAAVAAAGGVAVAAAGLACAPSGSVLPDLVADAPESPYLETDAAAGPPRLLMRFWGYVHNRGPGALDMRGSRTSTSAPMVAEQGYQMGPSRDHRTFAYRASPAELVFEAADGHNHWHVQRIARYSLWNEARTAEVAPSSKVGFCFGDTRAVDQGAAPRYYWNSLRGPGWPGCGYQGNLEIREGISAGWQDVYGAELPFQWVDVSGVQPGRYWLREDIDPDRIVVEADETNAPAYATQLATLPGHLARPVVAPAGTGARTVTLAATTFGTPGPRRFRIVAPPAHGTLGVPTGTAFAGPTVTYTPAPGWTGGDSFTFAALDANSPFPRSPASATVTLPAPAGVAARRGVLGLAGPRSVVAGTSAELRAVTARATRGRGVRWRVAGGRVADTISRAGVYSAPARVPRARGGWVTVAAGGLRHRLRVLPPPAAVAAPTAGARVGVLRVGRLGRTLVATFRPRTGGAVRIAAAGAGACVVTTPAGRGVTCRLRRPGDGAVTVTAALDGRPAATWRATPRDLAG